jgi:hypothetical protein
MELEQHDVAWATRSSMWKNRVEKALARRTKRAKAQPALILAGHGVLLPIENGGLTIQMDLRTTRRSAKSSDIFVETSRSLSASFYWTAAAVFPLMSCGGSPGKKSFLCELTGKAVLSASPAHRDTPPIPVACAGKTMASSRLIRS